MKTRLIFFLLIMLIPSSMVNAFQVKAYLIKGIVTDENGKPLQGAGISLQGTFLGTYSSADGRYNLKVQDAGEYTIKVSYTGYETVIQEITVNGEALANITLIPGVLMAGEVVVSSTRAGNRTPFAYSNIATDAVRKQNTVQDLPYLIGLTPSLVETSETGTGIGYTGFKIRGTDGSRINVTIDGIPLNDAESQQVFWVDLPDLASSVDNIQVQRGIGTSSNGAGAFGASVNMQSRNPETEPYAQIGSSVGSFNTIKNTIMTGTGLLSDRFSLEIRYSEIRSDGYIKRTGVNNKSAGITGTWRSDRSLVKANIILGQEHTGISWWGVPADKIGVDRRYNPAGEYIDTAGVTRFYENESDNYRQDHFQLQHSIKINQFLNLNYALHYTKGKGYYEEYRPDQLYSDYGLPVVIIDTSHIYTTDLIRRKWMSNDFYGGLSSLKFSRNRIDAVFGAGINKYTGRHFGRIIWMQNAGNTAKDHQWYLNKADKSEVNIFGKINYKFTDKLSGFADLQYRHISYKMNGPDDDLKDISQTHEFDFLNPKAGLYYSITSNQQAFLSFSVANREPTRSDFKEAAGDNLATPKFETLYDAETGYNLQTEKAKFGVNLYAMVYKNQLVPTGELSNVGYPIMTNVKSSYRVGTEIMAELKPFKNIEWDINATISRNKIENFVEYYIDYNTTDWSSQYKNKPLGSVDIAYSPSFVFSSDISYNPVTDLYIHFLSKYVGKQYFDNTMSSSRKIDPYFVSNLRIEWEKELKKIKRVGLQLLVNNIFNKLYSGNAYGGNWYEDGVEKTWAYYFPQAGTNFILKLELKF